ncbi:MAG: hypothetical protein NVS4B1_07630 [Ktedonobacteraceae bacterium]
MASLLVLADNNPILATGGQIAAIVIGLYSLLFIILTVVFGLTMDATFSWVSEKVKLIKMLRPTVDSVNKTSEAMVNGTQPPSNGNKIVQTVAQGPAQVHKLDKQVDQVTDKVANAVIEFRARTIQVQTVAKALFAPNMLRRELAAHDRRLLGSNDDLEIKSPGLRILMEEKVPDVPVVPAAQPGASAPSVTVSQLKNNVPAR